MCFERPSWWYEVDVEESDFYTDEELNLLYEQYIKNQEGLAEDQISSYYE